MVGVLAQRSGGLLVGQAGEETQFDQFGLAPVLGLELVERFVQRQQIIVRRRDGGLDVGQMVEPHLGA